VALDAVLVLRRYTDEPDDGTYTDEEMAERAQAATNLYVAARDIWIEKVAALAPLVDVSEGGSSRKMSQAYTQAKAMVTFYSELASAGSGDATGAVIRPLTRI
jgi:hypothetical protein